MKVETLNSTLSRAAFKLRRGVMGSAAKEPSSNSSMVDRRASVGKRSPAGGNKMDLRLTKKSKSSHQNITSIIQVNELHTTKGSN